MPLVGDTIPAKQAWRDGKPDADKTLECSINVRPNRIEEDKRKQEEYFTVRRCSCLGNSNVLSTCHLSYVNKDGTAQRKIHRVYCPLR